MKSRQTIPNRPDQDRKEKTGRLVFRLISLVFSGVVFYALFLSEFLKINSVSVVGILEISQNETERIIKEEMDGKYLGIIKKNNLLVFPQKRIENRLKNEFKKIRKVSFERHFPDKISCEIDERQLAILYFSGEKAGFVDENGIVYEEISPQIFWENGSGKIAFKNNGGQNFFPESEIADKSYISYIGEIKNKLREELEIETENFFETPNIISREVRVRTSQGWGIYFNTEIPLEKELETLEVFLEKGFKDANRSDLEYVDLRSENKIFYKLKNSEERKEEENGEEVKGEEDKKAEEKKDKKKKK